MPPDEKETPSLACSIGPASMRRASIVPLAGWMLFFAALTVRGQESVLGKLTPLSHHAQDQEIVNPPVVNKPVPGAFCFQGKRLPE